ncbi:MAG: biopolymer transporter ExbD [Proteobacteria bacterium]|nr:biopolymer transporter ExbD [Pseudomonadota bacterium]
MNDNDDGEITGINVTPLVDVMLVLLIVFMVTSTYIVQQSIQIQLPKADSGENTAKTKNLAFVMDKSGNLFMDGTATTIEQLPGQIQGIKANNPNMTLQAMIAADKETQHGQVVRLIDAIRLQGIVDLAINVESTKGL